MTWIRRFGSAMGRAAGWFVRRSQLMANPQMALLQRHRDPEGAHLRS
ncbi:hypothetical protein Q6346_09715 [Isoptericola sp. b490]|nr:hypothetical protein [Isoptericola sp. b490]MDO8121587.1 hypothetical protein [Isoptericola sp. b490]